MDGRSGAARRNRVASPGLLWVAFATALLLGVVPSTGGTARAGPVGSDPSPNGVAWAYAGTLEIGRTSLVGNVAVGFSDSTNYAVVFNQTAGNGSLVQVSITRLLTSRAYFIGCYPNCSSARASMTASGVGTEFDTADLTLTPNASVQVNGTPRAAWGLVAEDLTLSGNLTVRFSWENFTADPAGRGEWFNATTEANTTGRFVATTPLGLVPRDLADAAAWNGTGLYNATAATTFQGRSTYRGELAPANGSEFNETSVPISPLRVQVNGTRDGTPSAPALLGDTAIGFAPAPDGTSLVEGAVLVPTSAYIAAAFSSLCDDAQRACIGIGATPELDYNSSETGHLGWDAAVSAVSAFALFLNASAVSDTPAGLPFWPSGADVSADVIARSAADVPAPTTVEGLPIAVPVARSLQQDFHPRPTPNTTRSTGGTVPVVGHPPSLPAGHGFGPTPGPTGPLPGLALAGAAVPVLLLGGVVALAALGAGATALAARRRRSPRRREAEVVDPPGAAEPTHDEQEPAEDPLGYVW